MSRMIRTASPKVKPARRTARPAAPFGAGLLRYIPFAVTAPGFVEPGDADRRWAAQAFADASGPDYDRLAGEAAALASIEALSPPPAGYCRSCGEPVDSSSQVYCDACDAAGTEATIKGENGRAGLGYRVF
jgi:hypothetical protein